MAELSGLYYPNRLARSFLLAFEEVLGKNAPEAVANLANLPQYAAHLPPDNLAREFDFAYFAALCDALEEMYGTRGGRGMALSIGRAWFNRDLRDFGILAALSHPNFLALPPDHRVQIGLHALTRVLGTASDQRCTLLTQGETYRWIAHPSPMAWGRVSDKSVCHAFVGMLQGCLHYASGGYEFHVYEQACGAVNSSEKCEFVINRKPIGQVVGG